MMIINILVPVETLKILKQADIREALHSVTHHSDEDVLYMGMGNVSLCNINAVVLYYKVNAPLNALVNLQLPHDAKLFIQNTHIQQKT